MSKGSDTDDGIYIICKPTLRSIVMIRKENPPMDLSLSKDIKEGFEWWHGGEFNCRTVYT